MQTQIINFHTIYPNPLIQRCLLTRVDPDSFNIDFSKEEPNTITMQSQELTIGQFLDALIYCLALNDIDPLSYTITESNEHDQFTITITNFH
jgi:hypothetical protein